MVRSDVPFEDLIGKGTISRYVLYGHWHPNRFGYAIIARNAFEQITRGDLLSLGSGVSDGRTPMPVDAQQAEQVPVYPEPGGIVFGRPDIQTFLGDGWSGPEGPFRWTDSLQSQILFALKDLRAEIELRMRPFVFSGRLNAQRLQVTLNGHPVSSLSLTDSDPKEYAVQVPARVLQRNNILQFEIPDAQSPGSLGISKDSRRLGVAAEWVRLRH